MDDCLRLQLLDPLADLDLYREAYNFREPKKHLSAPRIDFETFTDTNPAHLTVGLFNGELQAVYFFVEVTPRHFDAHFTSRKGVAREVVLEGGRQVLDLILTHGGEEVSALIRPVNRPLRQFVTQLGMVEVEHVSFSACATETHESSIAGGATSAMFIKYAKRV